MTLGAMIVNRMALSRMTFKNDTQQAWTWKNDTSPSSLHAVRMNAADDESRGTTRDFEVRTC